jgi:hypothetical protein
MIAALLLAVIFPIFGLPLGVLGIIFNGGSRRKRKQGIMLCAASIFFWIIWAVIFNL